MTQVVAGGVTTQYVYNVDSARVKKVVGSTTTYYVGNWCEVTNGAATKYYYFGAQRVAMKQGAMITYLHSDHLGSTSVASSASGALVSRQTYYAFGELRSYDVARITSVTDYTFTGQKNDAEAGLMYYGARYYDVGIGRFTQADTIVPNTENPQSWNRYSYVRNNPISRIDPTGHCDPDDCRWIRNRENGWRPQQKDPEAPEQPVSRYNPGVSTVEAIGLVFDWFFNQGDPVRIYGPRSSLTQDVMSDPGMAQFRQVWEEAGYPVPFSWQHRADERNNGTLLERLAGGLWVYARENGELAIAIIGLPLGLNNLPPGWGPDSPIDAVGGILGSLDQISVYNAGNGKVTFAVYNEMNWASGLRVPGTQVSPPSTERNGWIPGGALRMFFVWTEPMPRR